MVDELENDVKSTAKGEKFNQDLNARLMAKTDELESFIAMINIQMTDISQ